MSTDLDALIEELDLFNYPAEAIRTAYKHGLEDAAKVCDERTNQGRCAAKDERRSDEIRLRYAFQMDESKRCAAAIRALKQET